MILQRAPLMVRVLKAAVLSVGLFIVAFYSYDLTSSTIFSSNFRSSATTYHSKGSRRLPTMGSLADTPPTASNHAPDIHGDYIMKQVLIPNGRIPNLTGFSRAIIKPHQMVQRHTHRTMDEVFYVEQGRAIFLVDEEHHVVERGGYIHIPAGEPHSVLYLADSEDEHDLVLLYFGIATG